MAMSVYGFSGSGRWAVAVVQSTQPFNGLGTQRSWRETAIVGRFVMLRHLAIIGLTSTSRVVEGKGFAE